MTAHQAAPRRRTGWPVVWFVNQYAGSPRHGMEFRHYELGRELVALGWTVVVVSGSFSHLYLDPPATRGTYTIEDVDGLRYCWIRLPAYRGSVSVGRVLNMLAFMAQLYRLPAGRLPRPDAIVVSTPSPFAWPPAARLARRLGARLVLEVRDIWPLTLVELGGLPAWHPLVVVLAGLERRACRQADAVVSVLPGARAHLERNGMRRGALTVIPNGASPDALGEAPGAPPTQVVAAVDGAPFSLGFVGTLGPANAVDDLIAAARLLEPDEVRVVIVGQGPAERQLRAQAADLPGVVFTGPVTRAEVPATLRAFDVCFVGYRPSPLYRFGISPNKLFDYMAAARPIVLAAAAANDPVRDAGCGITVAPGEPASLAAAIRSLRSMPAAERERLGADGRRFVGREHSYAALAARYRRVLDGSEP